MVFFQPSFFQTQSIVNVRRKWFVQPALTSEFVHYYHGKYNVNIFSHSLFIIRDASYRVSKKMTNGRDQLQVSGLGRCPSYRDSKKMTEER